MRDDLHRWFAVLRNDVAPVRIPACGAMSTITAALANVERRSTVGAAMHVDVELGHALPLARRRETKRLKRRQVGAVQVRRCRIRRQPVYALLQQVGRLARPGCRVRDQRRRPVVPVQVIEREQPVVLPPGDELPAGYRPFPFGDRAATEREREREPEPVLAPGSELFVSDATTDAPYVFTSSSAANIARKTGRRSSTTRS